MHSENAFIYILNHIDIVSHYAIFRCQGMYCNMMHDEMPHSKSLISCFHSCVCVAYVVRQKCEQKGLERPVPAYLSLCQMPKT